MVTLLDPNETTSNSCKESDARSLRGGGGELDNLNT
jgi:hypothetical protein